MQIIPLSALAAQSFSVVLAQQNCSIKVYQKTTGLLLDLSVAGKVIAQGLVCRDRVKLIRQAYLGFVGDLAFMDTQGSSDPTYEGLGARFQLMYLEASDL